MKKALTGSSLLALLILMGSLGAAISAGAASTKAQIKSKALSVSDLPAGWSADASTGTGGATASGCLKNLKVTGKHDTKVTVQYKDGTQAEPPLLKEDVETGPSATATYLKFTRNLNNCSNISVSVQGVTITGTVGTMSFPKIGKTSAAYSVALTVQGQSFGIDIVAFQVKDYIADIIYENVGSPSLTQFESFVTEAVNKIEGKPTGPLSVT